MPTRAAMTPPMAAPMPIDAMSSGLGDGRPLRLSVAAMATAMPTMPEMLPRRAGSWLASPRSDRMNSTAAMRYARIAKALASNIDGLLPEHRQHAAGHQEPAGDVDGREQRRRHRHCHARVE